MLLPLPSYSLHRISAQASRGGKMVGVPFDCLANPLGAVRLTFDRALADATSSGHDPSTFLRSGADWGALDIFHDFLFNQDGISHVPTLNPTNLHRIQPNTLVRFRGMVQDMLGNEFYVGAFKDHLTWRTNKFADVAFFPMASSSEKQIWERRLLYCVPVPGQNSWLMELSHPATVEKRCSSSSSQLGEKRLRESANDETDVSGHNGMDLSLSTKKKREDVFSSQLVQAPEGSIHGSGVESPTLDCEENLFACLVKMYDSPEADLKLNDVFEFIGIFTFDSELAVHKHDTEEFLNGLCDDAIISQPPSKVPCINCIIHRKLSFQDFLHSSPVIEPVPSSIRGIREALIRHLTAVLGNDDVAAQFMLLHLLSKVHARVDSLAVGKLSLNLTGFNSETIPVFGNRLELAIQSLLPFTKFIPLTVEYLNTANLGPKKDYKTNRLVTGVLQLAQGTHLTIDETQLRTGTLNANGVANAQLLQNLMDHQKVDYEFEFYKMEMVADVQVLILSEGKSNILPADLVLLFHPDAVSSDADVMANYEELKAWRWYLANLRSLPHTIDPQIQKLIEDDMVAARQVDRSMGADDFSRWLTMARLVSSSFGETTLSMEHWRIVKELERLRKERLR